MATRKEINEEDIDLMRLIYFNHSKLKSLFLTKKQITLVSYLKSKKASSSEIAKKYNISKHNASTQLGALFNKGYLDRFTMKDKTGGIFFEYTAKKRIFECVF